MIGVDKVRRITDFALTMRDDDWSGNEMRGRRSQRFEIVF